MEQPDPATQNVLHPMEQSQGWVPAVSVDYGPAANVKVNECLRNTSLTAQSVPCSC